MTEQEYWEQLADQALHEYKTVSEEQLRRQVVLSLKEAQKDARHQASDIMSEASSKTFNMRPGGSK